MRIVTTENFLSEEDKVKIDLEASTDSEESSITIYDGKAAITLSETDFNKVKRFFNCHTEAASETKYRDINKV